MKHLSVLALLLSLAVDVTAFTATSSLQRLALKSAQQKQQDSFLLFAETSESTGTESEEEEEERPKVDTFLEKKYPSFFSFMNDEMAKAIKQGAVTVFVPNEEAFEKLGQKKMSQINDPRNLEIREKMFSYHVIAGESVDAMKLRTEDWSKGRPKDGSRPNTMVAGINTLSGEVPVGRSKSGGFLGWGAKEDGDIVIGPEAKIVKSFNVDGSFVHEVDDLISPTLLWRYCDQLRIM